MKPGGDSAIAYLEGRLRDAHDMLLTLGCHKCELCGEINFPEEMENNATIGEWACVDCLISSKKAACERREEEQWIVRNR